MPKIDTQRILTLINRVDFTKFTADDLYFLNTYKSYLTPEQIAMFYAIPKVYEAVKNGLIPL